METQEQKITAVAEKYLNDNFKKSVEILKKSPWVNPENTFTGRILHESTHLITDSPFIGTFNDLITLLIKIQMTSGIIRLEINQNLVKKTHWEASDFLINISKIGFENVEFSIDEVESWDLLENICQNGLVGESIFGENHFNEITHIKHKDGEPIECVKEVKNDD